MRVLSIIPAFCSVLLLGCALPVVAQSQAPVASSGAPVRNQSRSTLPNYPGFNPYGRTAGFYAPNYAGITYPTFGAPKSLGGGFYTIPSGNSLLPMWQAPSGYYYPWAPRPVNFNYAYPIPVLMLQDSAPSPALPPLSTVFSDMIKFLDKSQEEKKISESDYQKMTRRVRDLQTKTRSLRIAAGGQLDSSDEEQIRRDIDQVGSELSWRINR